MAATHQCAAQPQSEQAAAAQCFLDQVHGLATGGIDMLQRRRAAAFTGNGQHLQPFQHCLQTNPFHQRRIFGAAPECAARLACQVAVLTLDRGAKHRVRHRRHQVITLQLRPIGGLEHTLDFREDQCLLDLHVLVHGVDIVAHNRA